MMMSIISQVGRFQFLRNHISNITYSQSYIPVAGSPFITSPFNKLALISISVVGQKSFKRIPHSVVPVQVLVSLVVGFSALTVYTISQ